MNTLLQVSSRTVLSRGDMKLVLNGESNWAVVQVSGECQRRSPRNAMTTLRLSKRYDGQIIRF